MLAWIYLRGTGAIYLCGESEYVCLHGYISVVPVQYTSAVNHKNTYFVEPHVAFLLINVLLGSYRLQTSNLIKRLLFRVVSNTKSTSSLRMCSTTWLQVIK
jgi:hypothetical protein